MRGRGEAHLFTGLVKCGECGRSFNYYLSRKETGNYRCAGKKRDKVVPEHYCKNTDISERKLIEKIWPPIEHFLQHPEDAVRAYEARLEKGGEMEKELAFNLELSRTNEKIAKKKKARTDAVKASFEDPEMAHEIRKAIDEFGLEIQALERQKESIEKSITAIKERKGLMESAIAVSEEFKKKLGEITDKDRNDYIKRLTHLVELFPDGMRVVYKFEK